MAQNKKVSGTTRPTTAEPAAANKGSAVKAGSAVKIPVVVRTAPTIVTNITGFLIISRGSSFLKASTIAGPTMFQSKRDGDFCVIDALEQFSLRRQEVLHDWPERERR